MSREDRSGHNSTAEQFTKGTTPEDVPLKQYRQAVYRPAGEDWEPPNGHEPVGENLYLAPDAADLAGLGVELVEAVERGATFNDDLVAELAGVLTVEEITKDRRKAYFTYEATLKAGEGPFLATPDGELFVYEDGVWSGYPRGVQRLRELGRHALGDFYGENVLRELKAQVRAANTIDRAELGVPEGTVATPDGLLNLHSGDVEDLRPNDYALNRISTSPDPEAEIEESHWWRYVEGAVPDGAERAKLQEYAGYTLLPGQPHKKALYLVGPTDSGKGTFLKAIKAVLGADNVANQPLKKLVDSRWGLDKIYGKMANVNNEVSPRGLKDVEMFKKMTGGEDTVTAERKGQPTYEFSVTQKFIFATNQFPRVPEADDAFFNRCLFAKFPTSIPAEEMDHELLSRLKAERATILNWMLDGLTRLMATGKFTGERTLEDKRALTKSFGSPIEQFVYEAIEVTGHPDDRIHKKEPYNAFTRFCDFIEAEDTPIQRTFTGTLKSVGGISEGQSRAVTEGDNREHVFTGLRVDEEYFKRIQAEVPPHAYTEDGPEGEGEEERADHAEAVSEEADDPNGDYEGADEGVKQARFDT